MTSLPELVDRVWLAIDLLEGRADNYLLLLSLASDHNFSHSAVLLILHRYAVLPRLKYHFVAIFLHDSVAGICSGLSPKARGAPCIIVQVCTIIAMRADAEHSEEPARHILAILRSEGVILRRVHLSGLKDLVDIIAAWQATDTSCPQVGT